MSDAEKMLLQMMRIRTVEEEIARRYTEQEMKCPVHLSVGQEAPSAAFSIVAQKSDFAVSTHRAHAHYLGKGGDLNAMIAELYGKVTGCSMGFGGSMHLADSKVGFMGSSAILGNSIPIGVGLGLAIKAKQLNSISWVFLGDAATEEGAYYESVNFAVLKNLPVIFLVENNGFSVYSDASVRRPAKQEIYQVAQSLGCKSQVADGNNAIEALEELSHMAEHVRAGAGPGLIEFHTFRKLEHCGPNPDDDLGYRTPEYLSKWADRDPIKLLEGHLGGGLDSAWLQRAQMKINREVSFAFSSAKLARFPTSAECEEIVYAR